jgi:histone-lysine N-methyltransferase SETD3
MGPKIKVAERNAAIETDYTAICDLFPSFRDTATLDEFKWARMCVCSRNFGIIVDGLRTSAMVLRCRHSSS